MQLFISKQCLILEHGGNRLEFGDLKPTARGAKGKALPIDKFNKMYSDALFIEINNYWKTLSKSRQNKLFEIYEYVHDDLMNARTEVERQRYLSDGVKTIADEYHSYEDIHKFMKSQKIIPSDKVKEKFDTSIDMLSRSTTYLLDDYYELACLTVIVRSIMPLWNIVNYDYSSAGNRAKNVYYEMDMYRSMRDTKMLHVKPFCRLREFIDATWENKTTGRNRSKSKNAILSSVVAGLGTSDIPMMLYSTSIVNKLAYREINTFRDPGDLITHIYQRLNSEIDKLGTKFANVRARKSMGSDDDDDKTTYLESFRTRERVRRDVNILTQYSLLDYRSSKKHLCDDIPVSLVKKCIDSFKSHRPLPIRSDQLIITQLILSKIVLHRALPQINRESMICAMALAQAALIHWKIFSIAKLMSSKPVISSNDHDLIATPFDTPSPELRQRLSKIYPCHRHSKATTAKRSLCPGFNAIDEIAKLFADQYWELDCSKTLENELRTEAGQFKPAQTLKFDLADMLIQINLNNKEKN